MKRFSLALFAAFLIFFYGCDLKPDASTAVGANGIVLYSGNVILNNKKFEIVTNRIQQLRAAGPVDHTIQWSSDNPAAVEVTQMGLIRSGRTPNKEAVITAVSTEDPSVKAVVTFRTKGLR